MVGAAAARTSAHTIFLFSSVMSRQSTVLSPMSFFSSAISVAKKTSRSAMRSGVRDTTDDAVVLDVDGAVHEYRWDDLGPGRVQLEFQRKSAGEDG